MWFRHVMQEGAVLNLDSDLLRTQIAVKELQITALKL